MRVGRTSHVLMIDDDEDLLGIMAIKLQHSGYLVDTAAQSTRGYELATKQAYDAIILDITMPELNGLDICKNLRAEGILTPILILSGNTEKLSIIRGLELGADDYLIKPFSHNELVARLRALVRRNHRTFDSRRIQKNGLELDNVTGIVQFNDASTQLTKKESLLLKRLMFDTPEPVSRELLLKDVWGIDDMHTSNRLDVYIRRLRSKLDDIGAVDLVQTQRGNGYSFGKK